MLDAIALGRPSASLARALRMNNLSHPAPSTAFQGFVGPMGDRFSRPGMQAERAPHIASLIHYGTPKHPISLLHDSFNADIAQ